MERDHRESAEQRYEKLYRELRDEMPEEEVKAFLQRKLDLKEKVSSFQKGAAHGKRSRDSGPISDFNIEGRQHSQVSGPLKWIGRRLLTIQP